jgi:hypothetical protein
MIGILKPDLGWLRIILTEGLKHEVLQEIPESYPYPLVINRALNESEILKIKLLLKNSGAILTDFSTLKKLIPDHPLTKRKIKYLVNDRSTFFQDIIGIELDPELPANAPSIITLECENGFIVAIPFDVNRTINSVGYTRKPFCSVRGPRFPSEIVSVVTKGKIRKLVFNCLAYLFKKLNQPFCHLWYYPEKYKTAFGFRVDTDFSSPYSIRLTYKLEDSTNLTFTYFIHTQYLFDLGTKKRDFELHCFEHTVYKDYQRNYLNIKQGKKILENLGINPIGFASPYGLWNENLAQAIEDNGLLYSSEFSLDYDDFPFLVSIKNRLSKVWQIPIHPICTGRLIHAGLKPLDIFNYYHHYFRIQETIREPIFIYDHPHHIQKFYRIFYELFLEINKASWVWKTNLTDFYHWWQKRTEHLKNSSWQLSSNTIFVNTANKNPNVYLRIIFPNDYEAFLPLIEGQWEINTLNKSPIPHLLITENSIKNYKKLHTIRTKLQIWSFDKVNKILKLVKIRRKK